MGEEVAGPPAAFRRLTEVSRALTYARSLDEVLELALDCALDLMGSEKAVLMLRQEGGVEIRAHRGIPDRVVGDFRAPLDETLLTRLSGVLGPGADDRFLGVPLVVRGTVIGLLAVRRPPTGPVSERDEWLLSALADQAAVAMQGTRDGELEDRIRMLEHERSSREHAIRVISHDLRSPLHAIQGYLELLASGAMGALGEEQAATVSRTRSIARHLGSLLESVVEAARLSGGELELHPDEVYVHALLRGAVDVIRPAADERGMSIALRVPDDLRAVVDPSRVRQVVVQLLENATRHCPRGSHVQVEARARALEDGPGFEIVVEDDGPGIPEERRDEVFEPYRSASTGTEGDRSGFGLGLSIVRSLLRRMGGAVTVDQAGSGGARFTIRLPKEPPD